MTKTKFIPREHSVSVLLLMAACILQPIEGLEYIIKKLTMLLAEAWLSLRPEVCKRWSLYSDARNSCAELARIFIPSPLNVTYVYNSCFCSPARLITPQKLPRTMDEIQKGWKVWIVREEGPMTRNARPLDQSFKCVALQ